MLRANFLYAAYRSHTTTVCTKSWEKYSSGTFAPRPGAITYTIAEAERNTHRYHRYPTLSASASNTRQPVSSAWHSPSVSCRTCSALTTGVNTGASFLRPPMTVPCEGLSSRLAHDCNKRFVGWAYRYLVSRISTQTEIPRSPLGIRRAGTGAVIIPGKYAQSQIGESAPNRVLRG